MRPLAPCSTGGIPTTRWCLAIADELAYVCGASTASTASGAHTSTPRPEHRAKVQTWYRAYLDLAKQLEASGNASEAREHRYLASECSRLMGVMDLLERAEAYGAWQPAYRALSAPGKE